MIRMDSEHEVLRDLLHGEGRRLTRQRGLVLQILESSDRHLDAEAIHDRVKLQDPDISLATVYRAVRVLRELGLIEEHSLGEDHSHYESPRNSPHYHFVCLRCGKVIEFDTPLVERAASDLTQSHGVQVKNAHLRLSGLCGSCQPQSRYRLPNE